MPKLGPRPNRSRRVLRAFACALAASSAAAAQSTPDPGLTLFSPGASTTTYLMDNNGVLLHQWPNAFLAGQMTYLYENGSIMRSIKTGGIAGGPPSIGGGAAGGGVQEVDWDGNVVWDFRYDTNDYLSHHDIEVMPDGNVLIIAWEKLTDVEAIALGRDPASFVEPVFFPDHVIEVQKSGPTTGNIVWEWHAIDHVVQDFDPTKPNFGVVANNPQRIDLNYPPGAPFNGEWLHVNSVKYSPELDQIVISPRRFSEFWILDHSTTTAEAASTTGGLRGKGGDLLYRWGNPLAYKAGTVADQKLFSQHDPNWVPTGYPGEGNIVLFNNGPTPAGPISTIDEIVTPVDGNGDYALPAPGTAWGPSAPVWQYQGSPPTAFYSQFISGAQRLPNGNTLACAGLPGWLVEVDPAGNVVWQYFNALPSPLQPSVFKVRRYRRYLFPEADSVSAAAGGAIDYHCVAGSDHAGRVYLLAGSFSGTSPGTPLPGGPTVPLNVDGLTSLIVQSIGAPMFANFFGVLDANGMADAQLVVPPGLDPTLVGLTAHFAFLTAAPFDFVSDAKPLTIDA